MVFFYRFWILSHNLEGFLVLQLQEQYSFLFLFKAVLIYGFLLISGAFVAEEVYILSIKHSFCFVKNVCMCICVCMCVHICMCVYVYMYACMYVGMYMHMYIYVLCICVHMYDRRGMCICVYMFEGVDIYMRVCGVWRVCIHWFCLQHHINLHSGPCLSS